MVLGYQHPEEKREIRKERGRDMFVKYLLKNWYMMCCRMLNSRVCEMAGACEHMSFSPLEF